MMVGTKAIATLSTGCLNASSTPSPACRVPTAQMTDRRPKVTITSRAPLAIDPEGLRRGRLRATTLPPLSGDAVVAEVVHGVDAKLAVKVNDLLHSPGCGLEQSLRQAH